MEKMQMKVLVGIELLMGLEPRFRNWQKMTSTETKGVWNEEMQKKQQKKKHEIVLFQSLSCLHRTHRTEGHSYTFTWTLH